MDLSLWKIILFITLDDNKYVYIETKYDRKKMKMETKKKMMW